jgi:putative molybdopterin biosynthesis protein
MHRKPYLEDIPLEEALQRFLDALRDAGSLAPLGAEEVSLPAALGRVTAAPVWADMSAPHYHAAAMDGVAVRAEDTHGASRTSPKRLEMGSQGQWVDTGDAMPPQFNAVIMVEDVQKVAEDVIEIMASVAPWENVRPLGEDIVATEMVIPENHLVRPVDLGAMAAAGVARMMVRRKPVVAVIPTGNELVEAGSPVKAGDIIEFNSLVLGGMLAEWGAEPARMPIVPDDRVRLAEALKHALANTDIAVVNAGSSAGSEDYTASVISELGQLLVHGIAIRPGHPVALGVVNNKPVLGLPGYPVAAALTAELLLKPLVCRMLGVAAPGRISVSAVMTRKVLAPMGQDEFLRVKLGKVGDKLVATPLSRGSGVIMSLVRADGIVRLPRFSQGAEAGAEVQVELLRRPDEVEKTIVAIGSHDLTLDVLANLLRRIHPDLTFASSNVGSMGGLIAIKRGEAHLGGSHLLDEETGEYNVSYVKRMLPGEEVVLLHLVYRQQGLIVKKGNPKGVHTLEDLLRDDISFINRQRGSGTRVLLDYEMKRHRLDPARVNGYQREEFTHTAVAAAVQSGRADVGLGIQAAARALKLDFIPLLKERYDLVMPRRFYESALLQPLLEAINSPEFKAQVDKLGGYDTSSTGKVLARIGFSSSPS